MLLVLSKEEDNPPVLIEYLWDSWQRASGNIVFLRNRVIEFFD